MYAWLHMLYSALCVYARVYIYMFVYNMCVYNV